MDDRAACTANSYTQPQQKGAGLQGLALNNLETGSGECRACGSCSTRIHGRSFVCSVVFLHHLM